MIYIVKHREYKNPVPSWYKEIGVGQLYNGTGENINHLNKYLNEATAYYDLWKNSNDKTLGVCHYRRFFAENGKIVGNKQINDALKDCDIIVPKRYKYRVSLFWVLRSDLSDGDELFLYNKYLNLIYQKEPKFKDYMMISTEFYPREMIITSSEIFASLCEQLFEIVLPLAEKYDREDSISETNPRLLGFITERLFSYLIVKNGWKVYEMDILEV